METQVILEQTKAIEQELIDLRNYLHTIPEIGGIEFKTSKFVEEEMQKLGLPTEHLTETCFYAILDTGKPGNTLVMRADIDGLPMDEEPVNKAGIKKPTVSGIPGMHHACGHDGHTALLMTGAKIICGNKEKLAGGKIYFLFEAGEENGASAQEILAFVKELKPDGMYGLHLSSSHDTGTISVEAGPRTAGVSPFEFIVKGRGGHSSRPDQSINPIVAAASAVTALQSLIPLYIDPYDVTTFAVTGIGAGTATNIIPDNCKVFGSYRFQHPKTGEKIRALIPTIVEDAVKTYGCAVEFQKLKSAGTTPTVNDPKVSAIAEEALRKVHPEMEKQYPALMGSESMGLYFAEVPGCFAWIGAASKELGTDAAHHNGYFDIDMSMLRPALDLSVQFAVDFLANK